MKKFIFWIKSIRDRMPQEEQYVREYGAMNFKLYGTEEMFYSGNRRILRLGDKFHIELRDRFGWWKNKSGAEFNSFSEAKVELKMME